jgi:hypothetical protein
MRKVVSSNPSHAMEELGRSSYTVPHPTQVQWVLGNKATKEMALE